MFFFSKKKPYYRRHKWGVPIVLVGFVIAIRIVLPSVIQLGLNSYLSDNFSPSLSAHVSDVDLAIIRGVYNLYGVTAKIKHEEDQFLEIKEIEISLPWREVFKNKMIADAVIDNLDILYSEKLMSALDKHSSKDKNTKSEAALVRVGRLDVKNSLVRTNMFPSLTRDEGILITQLDARFTNLNPTADSLGSPFSVKGLLLGSGKIKTEGELRLLKVPIQWTVDSELKKFNLTSLNIFLKNKLPLTFTRGTIDVYTEVTSQNGKMNGYIKPFVRNLDVIRSKEKFQNSKHWLIEIVTALGNVVMKADQTMATKIPFSYNKEFKVDKDEAISKAFANGFKKQLSRGIENSNGFKNSNSLQAQEGK